MFETNYDYLKSKRKAFEKEIFGKIIEDEDYGWSRKEDFENGLKRLTKNIHFIDVSLIHDTVEFPTVNIIYYVESSNILVKSMVNYRLIEIIKNNIAVGYDFKLKQIGYNFEI